MYAQEVMIVLGVAGITCGCLGIVAWAIRMFVELDERPKLAVVTWIVMICGPTAHVLTVATACTIVACKYVNAPNGILIGALAMYGIEFIAVMLLAAAHAMVTHALAKAEATNRAMQTAQAALLAERPWNAEASHTEMTDDTKRYAFDPALLEVEPRQGGAAGADTAANTGADTTTE